MLFYICLLISIYTGDNAKTSSVNMFPICRCSISNLHANRQYPTISCERTVYAISKYLLLSAFILILALRSDHQWRFKFLAEQLLPVLDLVVRPQEPTYPEIIKRDAAIRDFELPAELHIVDNDGVAPAHPIGMQQVWAAFTIETGTFSSHLHPFFSPSFYGIVVSDV